MMSIASILDEVNIDFEPLYKCIHVHDTLGKRNEFKTSYSEDRRVSPARERWFIKRTDFLDCDL